MLVRLLAAGVFAGALMVALGFGGVLAAPLDSLSHFRAHLGAALLLAAPLLLLWRRFAAAGAGLLAALLALGTTLPFLLGEARDETQGPSYSILQMNLFYKSDDAASVLRRIADTRPDVVAVQEMTSEWRRLLSPLSESYPFQVHCEGADGFAGDSALYSRRPFVDEASGGCDARNSLAAARVDFNGTGVTVASHHQLWPWPAGQWRRLARLEDRLAGLPGPVILAADFNAVPWSAIVRRYGEITGTQPVRGIGPTWFFEFLPAEWGRWMGLPIDNLLVAPQISVHEVVRLPATGSDHLPVLTRFSIARSPAAPAVQVVER